MLMYKENSEVNSIIQRIMETEEPVQKIVCDSKKKPSTPAAATGSRKSMKSSTLPPQPPALEQLDGSTESKTDNPLEAQYLWAVKNAEVNIAKLSLYLLVVGCY